MCCLGPMAFERYRQGHVSARGRDERRLGRRSGLVVLGAVVLMAGCASTDSTASSGPEAPAGSAGSSGSQTTVAATASSTPSSTPADVEVRAVTDLVLDPTHDYGDRYADGILPVGDGKAVTDGPSKGYVYLCRTGGTGGGAQERGPWFVNNNTEYDLNAKVHVEGSVSWDGEYDATVDGDRRIIATNDVPHDHTTGEFPVQPDDPAYEYDRNPNHIEEQDLTYDLAADPVLLDEPACMGGESGVMTTGVALFNAFDAGNRDAGAWEVQDSCDGHPQVTSEYHYHTLSSCIDDVGVETVIGFALDGFPITGPTVGEGNILTTEDLDECHGITSTIELDGRQVTTYHYVMTQDFPYSVSCFRGAATDAPGLPG